MFHTIIIFENKKKKKVNTKLKYATTTVTFNLIILIIIILQLFTIIEISGQESKEEQHCPYQWRPYNNRCFFTKGPSSTEPRSEAIYLCEAYGGKLAKIISHDENQFMRKLIQTYNNNPTWIGAEMRGSIDKNSIKKEWIDGSKMNYTNFDDKNSFECKTDCCGLTVDKNGAWIFKNCDSRHEYICEIDLGQTISNIVVTTTPTTTTTTTTTTTRTTTATSIHESAAEAGVPNAVQETSAPNKKVDRAIEPQASGNPNCVGKIYFKIHNILPVFILILKISF